MSSGAFVDGWRIVRSRRSEFVDAARTRRRALVSGLVAVVVGAILIVSDLIWRVVDVTPMRGVLVTFLLAGAAGCVVGSFWKIARSTTASTASTTGGRIDWRRSERIERQFWAHPPEILPEDRDEVISRARLTLGPAVVTAERTILVPIAWIAAWAGLLVAGATWDEEVMLVIGLPVFGLLQSVPFIAAVVGAGRADAAHRRTLALPPAPPGVASPGPTALRLSRDAARPGSQLSLPDD